MGKNAINILAEGEKRLDELNGKLKQTIENVLAINDAALKTGKNFFNVKTPKGLNESLKQNKTYVQQLNVELKERQRLEKALATQLERNRQAQSATAKALAEARFETQQLNRRAKEAAVLSSKLSTEYQKQAVRLTQLRRKYKDVALTQGESSKAAKRLRIEITQLDNRLKKVDANVGQFQRNVGNYGKAMRGAVSAARSLAGALGFTGGLYLAVQVFRDAANTVREFDKQVIAVQKTTNLTNPQIQLFKDEVIELGLALKGVSIQGLLKSSEIAGQLGIKGRKNILKFSEVIEKLKLTSDIAGEESARSFAKFIEVSNDSVENADRLGSVITELGNNFATSESQILKNTTEIQKGISIYDANAEAVIGLGAATNALGAEAEQSRSALQKTFKVLNDGATTGKNLENILALTGQTAEEFRKEFGENSVKTFQRFVEGLSKSDAEGKNLSNTLADLGLNEKRTEAVVGVLAKNYDVLSDALSRASVEYEINTALTREAEAASKSINSIIGDVSDAWDGLILSIDEGDGAISRFVKGALKDLERGLKETRKILGGFSYELQETEKNAFNGYAKGLEDKVIKPTQKNIKELEILLSKKQEEQKALNNTIKLYEEQESKLSATSKLFGNTSKKIIENTKQAKLNAAENQGQVNALKDKIDSMKESIKETEKETNATNNNTEAKTKANNAIKGSLKFYNDLIKQLKEEQSTLASSTEEYKKYQDRIDLIQKSIDKLTGSVGDVSLAVGIVDVFDTDIIKDTTDKFITDGVDRLSEKIGTEAKYLYDEFLSLYEWDLENFIEYSNMKVEQSKLAEEQKREELEKTVEMAAQFTSEIGNLTNAIFDNKIQKYEDDINRNQDYYANLLDNENLSLEQREALEAERDKKEREIEKKKREEQRKQAIAQKAFNAAEIIANTAVAVSKALAQGGFILGISQAAVVGALGAIQLAAVLAQPIPKYKTGKKKGEGKDSIALLNDGGKDELKISEDGTIQRITGRNVLAPVLKSDTIIPDAEKFLSNLSDQELYENIHKYSILASMSHQTQEINSYLITQSFDRGIKNQTKELVKAFKQNRPKINLYNNNSISEDLKYLNRGRDIL